MTSAIDLPIRKFQLSGNPLTIVIETPKEWTNPILPLVSNCIRKQNKKFLFVEEKPKIDIESPNSEEMPNLSLVKYNTTKHKKFGFEH